ncbi:hypothetical protein S1361_30575 [Streptomyces cyanogenus]|uniref:Uncharacterized protein n=1 Tax=Streptomyces cyanogenus TaxID=80860 RepID=A0ABX7U3Z7_STRCY|nr:hypothetical protein S1361_30575 [Streptomyces cyanogenus]
MNHVTPSVGRARRAMAGLFVTALVLAPAALVCTVWLLLA